MPDTTKAVIAGDIHLCRQIWSNRPEITGDAYNSWRQIVKYVVDNNIGTLALAGDIETTTKPSSEDVRVFREGIAEVSSSGARVVAIRGNHDWVEPPWFLASTDMVEHVNGKMFDLVDGIPFFGMDYHRGSEFPQVFDSVPKEAVGILMHNGVKEAFGIDQGYEFTLSDVPPHIRGLFMGHIHTAWDHHSKNLIAAYTSNTYLERRGARQETGFLVVSGEGSGAFTYNRVRLNNRIVSSFVVNRRDDVSTLVGHIDGLDIVDGLKPIVYLDYDPVEVPEDDVISAAGDKVHLFSRPFVRELKEDNTDDVLESDSVVECLGKCIEPTSPAYEVLRGALVDGVADKQAYFRKLRGEWGVTVGV